MRNDLKRYLREKNDILISGFSPIKKLAKYTKSFDQKPNSPRLHVVVKIGACCFFGGKRAPTRLRHVIYIQ